MKTRTSLIIDATNNFNNKYSNWYSLEKPSYLSFLRNSWYTNDGKINENKLFQSWESSYLNQDGTLNSNKLNQYMDKFLKAPFRNYHNDDRVRNILSLIYVS